LNQEKLRKELSFQVKSVSSVTFEKKRASATAEGSSELSKGEKKSTGLMSILTSRRHRGGIFVAVDHRNGKTEAKKWVLGEKRGVVGFAGFRPSSLATVRGLGRSG